jgi:AraC-like DNA-binding protein
LEQEETAVYVLYDTGTVHPFERYDYARAGAATEIAPVAIRGRTPGELLAVMSVARIGDFAIEVATWAADSELKADRTDRLIRRCDPECYRLYLSVNGGVRMEQAEHQESFGARDMALYDLSRPSQTTHSTGRVPMRVIMLIFPHALVPMPRSTLAPLMGTKVPKNHLIARFLIELTESAEAAEASDSGQADLLRECTIGLIRQMMGHPGAITPRTRQRLHLAHIREVIGRRLGDPALDPARIAQAAHISPSYLHKLFRGTETSPMQLVKRMRLEECHRRLTDPAVAATSVREIIAANGYQRDDQFAHDFKQHFGVSARQVRRMAGP